MKSACCAVVLLLFLTATQWDAFASTSDTLDCTEGLISLGDLAPDILRKCGQPTYSTQREEKIVDDTLPGGRIIKTFIIDDWTFNFGPTRFQYRLLLRDSKLWRIESMGYGY